MSSNTEKALVKVEEKVGSIKTASKICLKCRLEKPSSLFSTSSQKKDGLQNYCKPCFSVTYLSKKPHIQQLKIKYYAKHKKSILATCSQYYSENKSKKFEQQKLRYKNDTLYRLKVKIKNAVRRGLINRKPNSTMSIIGIEWEKLELHLLDGFQKVYNRYPTPADALDIDHIVPLVTASNDFDIIKLNHFSNLRYLLRFDNQVSKRTKLDWKPND